MALNYDWNMDYCELLIAYKIVTGRGNKLYNGPKYINLSSVDFVETVVSTKMIYSFTMFLANSSIGLYDPDYTINVIST